MQLWEQGKLNLDAPIQQYVPQFPAKQWPVTARQLLGHLGGIRHYQPGEIESVKYYLNRVDPLAIFANDPLIAEPGTRYSYSTYGFNLLGAAVELVAGQPFATYLKQNVFTPAGMLSISADDTFELIPHRSRGYSLRGDGVLINCGLADTSNKIPGGGMIGTASDLVRFALALDAGRLVKPETMKLMFARQVLKDGKTTGYGLGFGIDPIDGKERVGHSGGQQGTSTYLCLYPKEGVAIAVMINRDSANAMTIANAVGRLLLP
jgi:CubicO group peptidase (beta-lactamase class C family)